jgi:rhomboid protease GluP
MNSEPPVPEPTPDPAVLESQQFAARLREVSAPAGVGSVTNWIIGIDVLAFVVMGFFGAGWLETASMDPYVLYVANSGAATTAGEWWRLVTCMFVHYGLLHLAVNMWALFQIGHLVERLFGRSLFTLVYFASGITGSLATLYWHGDKVWSAGASGAIFGVCGALLGYLWREKHGIPQSVLRPLLKSGLTFIGYNLFIGAVVPNIDNVAHLGGLLGGVLFGWLCALPLDREIRARTTGRRFALGFVVLAAVVSLGVATVPRYDFLVGEELQLEKAAFGHPDEEKNMLAAGQAAYAETTKRQSDDYVVKWIRDRAIPFYESRRAALLSLHLSPRQGTVRRRDALVRIFTLKIDSYRQLLDAIERHDETGADRFAQQQREVERAQAAFKAMPR